MIGSFEVTVHRCIKPSQKAYCCERSEQYCFEGEKRGNSIISYGFLQKDMLK